MISAPRRAERRPRERAKKHEAVLVGRVGETSMINTVVEEQRIARVAHHGDAVLPEALRVVGSPSVTAEPELRRPVRGGERLERHEYRQRVRLVGLVLVISVLVVILMRVGACARDHHAAVEQICTATEGIRRDVEHTHGVGPGVSRFP